MYRGESTVNEEVNKFSLINTLVYHFICIFTYGSREFWYFDVDYDLLKTHFLF